MNIQIRPELQCEYECVENITRDAFSRNDEATLLNTIRKTPNYIPELSLVARNEEEVLGHILFTKVRIINEETEHTSIALGPMSVISSRQKEHIGSQLVLAGLDAAKQLGYSHVIVLGHENYYPKFGFQPAKSFGIRASFDVPSSYFMARELDEGSLSKVSGFVVYDDAFSCL